MLTSIVFLVYVVLFAWLLTKQNFFLQTGLGKPVIVGVFLLKVLAGLAYAFYYQLPAYYADSDTYRFFRYSLEETDMLLHRPSQFFTSIFSHGYSSSGNIFIAKNSYWNDLKSNVVIKLLAIFNVFTGKNYYANIVLFNFLCMYGVVAFYKVMQHYFKVSKWVILVGIVCIPSFLFWCSGIHKDGLLFTALALIIYYLWKGMQFSWSVGRIFLCLGLLLLVFVWRNYAALALLPASVAWYMGEKAGKKWWKPFLWIYVVCLIGFLASFYVTSLFNLPNYLVQKQQEFKALSGGSAIHVPALAPEISSFLRYLPTAIDVAFMRPHLSDFKNFSYLPATLEVYAMGVLLLLFCLYSKKQHNVYAFLAFLLIFSGTVYLVYGFTITFSGAIIRYRSVFLPFILCPMLCSLKIWAWKPKFLKVDGKI